MRSSLISTVPAAALLLLSACGARACVEGHDRQVVSLAKRHGVDLVVRDCQDASRGATPLAPNDLSDAFSCITHVDAAQKKRLIDGFGMHQGAYHLYTPTEMGTCYVRNMPKGNGTSDREVWYADVRAAKIRGTQFVWLYVEPSGEACIDVNFPATELGPVPSPRPATPHGGG